MSLYDTLMADMKAAMLSRDAARTQVLRSIKSALSLAEIATRTDGARAELTDAAVVQVLMKAAKQRKDSISQFDAAGRADLAAIEIAELAIIEEYLPRLMSEDEIRILAAAAIAKTGASGPADMGKVMAALMPQVKGKADGALVNSVVRSLLG